MTAKLNKVTMDDCVAREPVDVDAVEEEEGVEVDGEFGDEAESIEYTCDQFCNTNPELVEKLVTGMEAFDSPKDFMKRGDMKGMKKLSRCYSNCINCSNFSFVAEGASYVVMCATAALTLSALF